jgi:hypothetical protein
VEETVTFLATERVDVQRGTTVNELGDEVDDPTPVVGLQNISMSIIEKVRNVYGQDASEDRTVRTAVGRTRPGRVFQEGDRIVSRLSGRTWYVNEVSGGTRTIAGFSDLVLDLRTGNNPVNG